MKNVEVIEITVDDVDDIFHKFDNSDISDELASFIENRCSRIAKNEVHIRIITGVELTNTQKDSIVTAIRSHYGLETKFVKLDIKKLQKVNICYFVAGLLTILIANIISIGTYITEVVDVLGGFIIYESAFNLLFTDNQLDLRIERARKISKAHIYFSKK